MELVVGDKYLRRTYQPGHWQSLGKYEKGTYLPRLKGVVASAWVRRDYDHLAPQEVWVQDRARVKERAAVWRKQGYYIPVFLKESSEELHEYLGRFRVDNYHTIDSAPSLVAERQRRLKIGEPGYRPLYGVLVLKPLRGDVHRLELDVLRRDLDAHAQMWAARLK